MLYHMAYIFDNVKFMQIMRKRKILWFEESRVIP